MKYILAVVALCLFAFPAFAQGPLTTTVADTIYQENGSPQTGSLVISNPNFVSPDGYAISASQETITLSSSGTFSVALVPTFGGTPAGTYYSVQINPTSGPPRTEQWSIPYFPTALTISQIIVTGPGTPIPPLSGDVVGSFITSQVVGLHFGTSVVGLASTAPINGDCLTYNSTTGQASFTAGCSGSGGSGVSSFSAQSALSPLFTTSVANPTSTPALSFALLAAAGNTIFGNCTGSSGAPSYCGITAAMLPTLSTTVNSQTCTIGSSCNIPLFYQTLQSNTAAQNQRANLNFSTNFSLSDNSGANRSTVDLAGTISSNTSGNAATASNMPFAGLTSIPGLCPAHQWSTGGTTSSWNCTQPAYSDISGTPTLFNQTIQNSGTPVTQESALNFTGTGISSVVSSSGVTTVTVMAGSGGSGCTPPGTTGDILYDGGSGACNDFSQLTVSGNILTAGAGLTENLSAATLIRMRNSAGATTSINGDEAQDTTTGFWHDWQNGADRLRLESTAVGNPGQLAIDNGDGTYTPGDPIVSYNYVNLFTTVSATATHTSSTVRVSTFSQFGTLFITWASITGSPATCTIQMKSSDSLGNLINNGGTISVTPSNGTTTQTFSPAAGIQTAAQMQAVFACGTYPTAGTLSLDFVPGVVTYDNQSGTWTVQQGGSNWTINETQIAGNAIATAASGIQKVGIVGSTGTALDSAAGTPNSQVVSVQGNASGIPIPTNIADYGGSAVPGLGQQTMANSISFVPASNYTAPDVGPGATPGTAAANSALVGCVQQSPSPTSGQQVSLNCDSNGNLKVSAASLPLPTGAATSANQCGTSSPCEVSATSSANGATNPLYDLPTDGTNPMGLMALFGASPGSVRALGANVSLFQGTTLIGSGNPLQVTGANGTFPVTGTFWQTTQPVSGTFWPYSLGQTSMSASVPVTMASNQANINVNCAIGCTAGTGGTFVIPMYPAQSPAYGSSLPVTEPNSFKNSAGAPGPNGLAPPYASLLGCEYTPVLPNLTIGQASPCQLDRFSRVRMSLDAVTVPIPDTPQDASGMKVVFDPCQTHTKQFGSINATANAQIITGVAGYKIVFCSWNDFTNATQGYAVVEGSGSTCATLTAAVGGLSGGTTGATGWQAGSSGLGHTFGNGAAGIGATITAGDSVCIFLSGANQVNAGFGYVLVQ